MVRWGDENGIETGRLTDWICPKDLVSLLEVRPVGVDDDAREVKFVRLYALQNEGGQVAQHLVPATCRIASA